MSEPVVRPRYLGEPRDAFDLEEIERRMREAIEPPKPPKPAQEQDPLAELARLVGQTNNDAFNKIFGDQGGPTAPPPSGPRLSEPPPLSTSARDQLYAAAYDRAPEPRFEEPFPFAEQPRAPQGYAPQEYAPQSLPEPDYPQQGGYAQQGYAQETYQPAPDNQAYAYGQDTYPADTAQQDADWRNQYQQDAYYDEPPRRTGRAKLLIGAAILVVLGGSSAAYFLRGTGVLGRDAPTIMANSGPTKVQPAEPASEGPKQSISILERGPGGSSQSKLVQNEEQPVDVSATARASGARPARAPDAGVPVTLAPPPPAVANSIFAEPKRVKAVAVRPDGTIIDPGAPARPAAPVAAPTPAPATPTPAPVSRPMDIASLVASTTPSSTPASAPKPPVKAADPKPAEPKPVAKPATPPATTASIPAASGAGGGFAVQLAGTTSLDEAKDAVERLSRKFSSELGGYRPSVVKADVGSKTVYRVRVVGMSSEDANTLCARLKSGGGSCFVARD